MMVEWLKVNFKDFSFYKQFLFRNANVFCSKRPEDPSQLIHTFEVTELCGIVSLLYGMLLHSGAPSRSPESRPRELSASTVSIILTGLRMLNNMAVLDLQMLQVRM